MEKYPSSPPQSWTMMNKYRNQLSILDINGQTGSRKFYPIQPYRVTRHDFIGFPSQRFSSFICYYHQSWVPDLVSPQIYPAFSTAIVCRLNNHEPQSFFVGTPTSVWAPEYIVPKSVYFVAFLWPGIGYELFPFPAGETCNISIPLDEIFPERGARLTYDLMAASSFSSRINIFETFIEEILKNARMISSKHMRLIESFIQPSGEYIPENRTEKEADFFSDRHIRRLFSQYVGLTPKFFYRTVRYQKTLRLLNQKKLRNFADIAAEEGYFDQSHLIKEFKEFHGLTPYEFIKQMEEINFKEPDPPLFSAD